MSDQYQDKRFFSLKKENRLLYYFGAEHSWNPSHPQFSFIKEKWNEFLKTATNIAVIVEAIPSLQQDYTSESDAIIKKGETGLMEFLARQADCLIACLEPSRQEEMNFLAQQFPRNQIAYYYFARTVAQWHRLTQKPDQKKYLDQFFQKNAQQSGWSNFDFSLGNMETIHSHLFQEEFNLDNEEFFKKIEHPFREDNPLKNIVQLCRNFRNQEIIKGIQSMWINRDVFIVYGLGHLHEHREILSRDS